MGRGTVYTPGLTRSRERRRKGGFGGKPLVSLCSFTEPRLRAVSSPARRYRRGGFSEAGVTASENPVEPGQRQQRRGERQQRCQRREERGDLGLFLLEHEARIQRLVD